MKLNISYSPDEEDRVKRLARIVVTIFPTTRLKYVQKDKYMHCYMDTKRKK